MDREAEARAIVEAARAGRKRPSKRLWFAAIVASVVCTTALVIAWFREADTIPDKPLEHHAAAHSSGLGLGLLIGIGFGIVVASVTALRGRKKID